MAADPVEAVARVLARATADGSTAVPTTLLRATLPGLGVDDVDAATAAAVDAGIALNLPAEGAVAPADLGRAEADLAELLIQRLTSAPGLAIWRRRAGETRPLPPSDGAVVVNTAERLGVAETLELVRQTPSDARLVLVGEPDGLPPPAPGRAFADLVTADVVQVSAHPPATDGVGVHLHHLVEAIREGNLPAVADPSHQVVVVPATTTAQAVRRVEQVVVDSLPRRFGLTGDDVCVLSPRRSGAAGAAGLHAALSTAGRPEVPVLTVGEAVGRAWPAVVVVLPASAAGTLSRALLLTAFGAAESQLTVVHQSGPALARAVKSVPGPFRRTQLTRLLSRALGPPER